MKEDSILQEQSRDGEGNTSMITEVNQSSIITKGLDNVSANASAHIYGSTPTNPIGDSSNKRATARMKAYGMNQMNNTFNS